MFRKVIIGIAILYLISILAVSVLTFLSTRAGLQDTMIERYKEHFRSVSNHVEALFEDIRSDLETLAANKTARTRDDAGFTSFLNADENTFQYNYNETELAIIELFHTYVVCHPYVNSVYMGRANGSFVRSHPRAAPTRYDPRERPWYLAAIQAGASRPSSTHTLPFPAPISTSPAPSPSSDRTDSLLAGHGCHIEPSLRGDG